MHLTRQRLQSIVIPMAAGLWLTACMLPTKSTGELADESGSNVESGDAAAALDELDQRSVVIPTPDGDVQTTLCDIAIAADGRVAVTSYSIPVVNGSVTPPGQTRLDVFAADTTLIDSVTVAGQMYGAIAFVSDGTLRVRGSTSVEPMLQREWFKALDANLEETWSVDYDGQYTGWSDCTGEASGILVDEADRVVTYEYVCASAGECPQSIVRRYEADGTLLWERNPGGNPAYAIAAIAVGADQAVFHGALIASASEEAEIRKYSAAGDEEWMTVLPGSLQDLRAAADGGVFAFMLGGDPVLAMHRLDAAGVELSVSPVPEAERLWTIVGPTADDKGFFVLPGGELRRVTSTLDTMWSTPLPFDGPLSYAQVSTMRNYGEIFAFAGLQGPEWDRYWITIMFGS